MPASETPTNPTTPQPDTHPSESAPVATPEISQENSPESVEASRRASKLGYSTSRYVDYDAHELLEKISQYEDDRRWQRIREGIWISIIAHILLFSGLTWIPRYVFHQPQLIDPFDAIKKRKDLTYLDELPDAVKQIQRAKPKLKPNNTVVDKKTLDALKALEKARPKPPAPQPKPEQATPPPQPTIQAPQQQPAPTLPSTATPQPSPQIPLETPRPAPVPARPNFSLGSQSPADQLHQAMRDSAHGPSGGMSGGALSQHSGADGGAQILSDTQGVDFGPYLQKVIRETYRTWDPLIPEEVNPPILKRGQVEIIFTILPNGRVAAVDPNKMQLTGRSGDTALDRAAWGAIQGADYPQLPREFHGPYLELRFRFEYNMR
jgi:TonB C terminal